MTVSDDQARAEASRARAGERTYRCPKCDGLGWLRYNPAMPFGDSTSSGPWRCSACIDGIIYGLPGMCHDRHHSGAAEAREIIAKVLIERINTPHVLADAILAALAAKGLTVVPTQTADDMRAEENSPSKEIY